MASLLSDSDDDSLLDAKPAFSSRKKRAQEKSREKDFAYLDGLMNYETKAKARQIKMESIEQQECNLDRVEAMIQKSQSSKGAAEQKRKLRDEINGISEQDGHDQKRLAVDPIVSIKLGVRQTLSRSANDDAVSWTTEEEVEKELKRLLKEQKNARNLVESLLKAIQMTSLTGVLDSKLIAKLCQKHKTNQISEKVIDFLFRLACCGGDVKRLTALSIGAFETLVALCDNENIPSSNFAALKQIPALLEEWHGLINDLPDVRNVKQDEFKVHSNMQGMRHFLVLCTKMLDNSTNGGTETIASDGVDALLALTKAGIDVTFYSAKTRLVKPLGGLLESVVRYMSRHFSDEQQLNQWMRGASQEIMDQCSGFGPGFRRSEDEDDPNAWLCTALVVRLFQGYDEGVCCEFRALLAIEAMKRCLGIADWESHLESTLKECELDDLSQRAASSLRWKAIASPLVGLASIAPQGNTMVMDGPRFSATVGNVSQCMETALFLSSSAKGNGEQLYGNKEEAMVFCKILNLLDESCNVLLKRVKPMSSSSHHQRVAYCLSSLRGYCRRTHSDAGQAAGITESSPKSVQQSITSWMTDDKDSDDDDPSESP